MRRERMPRPSAAEVAGRLAKRHIRGVATQAHALIRRLLTRIGALGDEGLRDEIEHRLMEHLGIEYEPDAA
jgi:hypothetical protein